MNRRTINITGAVFPSQARVMTGIMKYEIVEHFPRYSVVYALPTNLL